MEPAAADRSHPGPGPAQGLAEARRGGPVVRGRHPSHAGQGLRPARPRRAAPARPEARPGPRFARPAADRGAARSGGPAPALRPPHRARRCVPRRSAARRLEPAPGRLAGRPRLGPAPLRGRGGGPRGRQLVAGRLRRTGADGSELRGLAPPGPDALHGRRRGPARRPGRLARSTFHRRPLRRRLRARRPALRHRGEGDPRRHRPQRRRLCRAGPRLGVGPGTAARPLRGPAMDAEGRRGSPRRLAASPGSAAARRRGPSPRRPPSCGDGQLPGHGPAAHRRRHRAVPGQGPLPVPPRLRPCRPRSAGPRRTGHRDGRPPPLVRPAARRPGAFARPRPAAAGREGAGEPVPHGVRLAQPALRRGTGGRSGRGLGRRAGGAAHRRAPRHRRRGPGQLPGSRAQCDRRRPARPPPARRDLAPFRHPAGAAPTAPVAGTAAVRPGQRHRRPHHALRQPAAGGGAGTSGRGRADERHADRPRRPALHDHLPRSHRRGPGPPALGAGALVPGVRTGGPRSAIAGFAPGKPGRRPDADRPPAQLERDRTHPRRCHRDGQPCPAARRRGAHRLRRHASAAGMAARADRRRRRAGGG